MVLKETRIVKYEIDTPGFEGVEFTESSKYYLIWPEAVKFAADQNAVLQSIREAGAFRIEARYKIDNYRDDFYSCQATRTGAICFRDGSKFYVAFDDTPDVKQNIILARAVEGYESHRGGRGFGLLVSKKDKQITQILKRAEKNDRIVQVVESPLELATKASNGVSEFGSNKAVQALFGDVAEPYAAMLHKHNYSKGVVDVFTHLGEQVADDKALVRAVSLGEVGSVDAIDRYCNIGRARGVRGAREFSR